MYLLDTHVILELRKAKSGQTDPGLIAWAASIARPSLFISALNLLELDNAAGRLARKDKAAGAALKSWVDMQVRKAFDGRILAIDAAVVTMLLQLPPMRTRDGLLAATAKEHGLTLATRNVAAFKAARVKLVNPWGYRGEDIDEDGDWRQATKSGPVWLKSLFVRA